ncbi:MAG: LamG domain-containing protein [Acidobacteria bacterium]|nr:LamG domain-containing protein [Acidobacteriota bacterium]
MSETMSQREPQDPGRRRLDSWKEIALYLGKDIRTVQRWESRESLPIHRHMHESKGSVFAFPEELDEWKQRRSVTEHDTDDKPTTSEPSIPFPQLSLDRSSARRRLLLLPGIAILSVFAALAVRHSAPPQKPKPIPLRLLAQWHDSKLRRLPLSSRFGPLVASTDERTTYAALPDEGVIAEIGVIDGRLRRRIQTGGRPYQLALKRDGRELIVSDEAQGLYLVDLSSGASRLIRTDGAVSSILLSPNEDRLFLAMAYKGLKVLDLANEQLRTLPGVVCPMSLAADPKNNLLWVSCRCGGPGGRLGHDNIDVLDFATERSVRTVGGPPLVGGHIAVSSDGALVAIDGSDACISPRYDRIGCPPGAYGIVQVFRASDSKHLTTLLTSSPGFLYFTPDNSRLLHTNGKHLSVFETSSFRQVESLEQHIMYAILSPSRQELYTILREPNEWVAAPLNDLRCDFRPEGLYSFHWSADGIFTDLGGSSHGAPHHVEFQPGLLGQAFQFNGSSSFLDSAPGDSAFFLGHNMTYMLWLKPSRSSIEETLLQRIHLNQPDWRMLRRPDGRIELEFPRDNRKPLLLTSVDTTATDHWSHIALVTGQENVQLYLNGKPQGFLSANISDQKGGHFRFGAGFRGGNFAGHMDEVTVHARPFSRQEIQRVEADLRRCHIN